MEHYPPQASYECGEVTTPECIDFAVCTPSLVWLALGENEERGRSKEEDNKEEMQSNSDAKLLC